MEGDKPPPDHETVKRGGRNVIVIVFLGACKLLIFAFEKWGGCHLDQLTSSKVNWSAPPGWLPASLGRPLRGVDASETHQIPRYATIVRR